jgi:ABC-type sugar transport system substrate-binding protein
VARPTIRDVAARAGVSTATVSRALSGARPVSSPVAELVRRAAADLGYSGNGIASALRRNRTDTVGMVVPSIANPFFTALVESVEHAPAGSPASCRWSRSPGTSPGSTATGSAWTTTRRCGWSSTTSPSGGSGLRRSSARS